MSAARSDDTADERGRYHLVIPTDVSHVGATIENVAAYCFAEVVPSPRTWFRLCTVLAEALANAMDKGNRGNPRLHVMVDVALHTDRIVITVSDEGEGFDPGEVTSPQQSSVESTTGRGLFLIRQLADDVRFNAQGNTIWITLPRV